MAKAAPLWHYDRSRCSRVNNLAAVGAVLAVQGVANLCPLSISAVGVPVTSSWACAQYSGVILLLCFAGGRYAQECTLILTEGDSAKTSCLAGLSVVGREKYGVFPLRVSRCGFCAM